MSAPHTASPSAPRSSIAVTVPSRAPSAKVAPNQPHAGSVKESPGEGAIAKMAPAATRGTRSSAAPMSRKSRETGPFAFQRDWTHSTA
jgi:hypothetical protein